MNQYHIRIDGEQSTDSYTYQELADIGLFSLDFDSKKGIEIKKTTDLQFTPLNSFVFSERSSNNLGYVDESGIIHRETRLQHSIEAQSASSSNSSNNTSDGDGWIIFGKVLVTIIVIIIAFAIALLITNSGGGRFWTMLPLAGGYWILKEVWD